MTFPRSTRNAVRILEACEGITQGREHKLCRAEQNDTSLPWSEPRRGFHQSTGTRYAADRTEPVHHFFRRIQLQAVVDGEYCDDMRPQILEYVRAAGGGTPFSSLL